MATHSSILAWEIPWTEEPGGLSSPGLLKAGQDLVTEQQQQWKNNVTLAMVLNFGCSAELLRMHLRPIISKLQEREGQCILSTPTPRPPPDDSTESQI